MYVLEVPSSIIAQRLPVCDHTAEKCDIPVCLSH